LAVYGRRRVRKSFLVRTFFQDQLVFELSGVSEATLRQQLANFAHQLAVAMRVTMPAGPPVGWAEAMGLLRQHLESALLARKGKLVVFFDELPWLSSRRSGFLAALEHFWNSWGSQQGRLVLVVCGSAASWMLDHVIKAKGGLHNRVTRRLRLLPFTLGETRAYLKSRHIDLDTYQVVELYMAMGGIPHDLKELKRGESAAQSIDRICFREDGLLHDEFNILYRSLFEHAERHESVVRALAKRVCGLSRQELLEALALPSGGNVSSILEELEVCGFIMQTRPFGKTKKDALFRLSDEYSLFFLQWIEKKRVTGNNVWATRRGTPAWRAWSGYAFEGVCIRHTDAIKRALGVAGVETTASSWYRKGDSDTRGAQIDLVIDRKDMCINLCEMKFSESPFTIDKAYAQVLKAKVESFRSTTKTRKALFVTLITTNGVKPNEHSRSVVDVAVEVGALF